MGPAAFDTLKAAKRLGGAGFDSKQAESIADIIGESINDKLASKDDLRNLEMRLTGKIESGYERLTGKIEVLDTKIDTVEERLTGKIDALDTKIGTVEERLTGKIDALDTKIDTVEERLTGTIEKQIASLKADLAGGQVTFHRWMIGLGVTLVIGFAGMILVG